MTDFSAVFFSFFHLFIRVFNIFSLFCFFFSLCLDSVLSPTFAHTKWTNITCSIVYRFLVLTLFPFSVLYIFSMVRCWMFKILWLFYFFSFFLCFACMSMYYHHWKVCLIGYFRLVHFWCSGLNKIGRQFDVQTKWWINFTHNKWQKKKQKINKNVFGFFHAI